MDSSDSTSSMSQHNMRGAVIAAAARGREAVRYVIFFESFSALVPFNDIRFLTTYEHIFKDVL